VTAQRELSFDTALSRQIVHKRALEEVLLCDSAPNGPDGLLCAAQLPRAHRFYNPEGVGLYDFMLLLELVRQTTIVVGHRLLGVPDGRQFVLNDLDVEVTDLAAMAIGAAPAEVVVEVTARNVRRLEDIVAAYDVEGVVHVDRRPAARGSGRCMALEPDDYAAVRGVPPAPASADARDGPPPAPVEPARVGRADRRDVVVAAVRRPAASTAASEVVVDTTHPSFFDHPLDHVPGMLLLEACRQTAVAASADARGIAAAELVVRRCRARFTRFAELGVPLICTADLRGLEPAPASPPVEADVVVAQGAARVCEATLALSHEPRGQAASPRAERSPLAQRG
jgi:2-oxo-3-(phosphooxy)propyl 3-oxoalkanoate synthase